jgi:hypothetical protein
MYSCDDSCGKIGTIEHVFEAFKDSLFVYYYTQLAATERSIYDYRKNPTQRNKDVMESDISQARLEKQRALILVPSSKQNDYMQRYPSIIGGGYVEGEPDLGSDNSYGGSIVDPGATPILPNGQNQSPTPTLTSTPTQRPAPTQTAMPTQTNRPNPIPRRYSGEIID